MSGVYVHTCMRVCVFVCVRKRERERLAHFSFSQCFCSAEKYSIYW